MSQLWAGEFRQDYFSGEVPVSFFPGQQAIVVRIPSQEIKNVIALVLDRSTE